MFSLHLLALFSLTILMNLLTYAVFAVGTQTIFGLIISIEIIVVLEQATVITELHLGLLKFDDGHAYQIVVFIVPAYGAVRISAHQIVRLLPGQVVELLELVPL